MINCDQHDYIEIACTYRYPITLTLKSGEIVKCIGIDTQYDDQRRECIQVDSEGTTRLVVLDTIARLEANQKNPHFQAVSFGQESTS